MPTLALHGRASQLASVEELIAGDGGSGGVLVVRGEAGIGKSTLLAAARDRADAAGMAVLSATGVQSEAHLYRLFPKLGITSRAQLSSVLAGH